MRMLEKLSLGLMSVALTLVATVSAAEVHDAFRFVPVDVPGATQTTAHGINNRGQVVGEFVNAAGQFGFVLEDGRFTAISAPGDRRAGLRAFGINEHEQIVGDTDGDTGTVAFLRDRFVFSTFNVPGASFTTAMGVNNGGTIVGMYGDSLLVRRGFVARKSGFLTIEEPGATEVSANGINERGQIVGHL